MHRLAGPVGERARAGDQRARRRFCGSRHQGESGHGGALSCDIYPRGIRGFIRKEAERWSKVVAESRVAAF
jgi:hypothetical protein